MQHQARAMMQRFIAASILFVVLVVGPACRSKQSQGSSAGGASADTLPQAVGSVVAIDQAGLKQLLQQRNGKILFLNIWATWCAPCVEEFPDLVRLAGSYKSDEVEFVGISADYPDEVDSKILPFVRKQRVPFRIYVASFNHQEDFINAVNPSWSGALPATMIVDPSGRQMFFRVGAGTFGMFKSSLDSILYSRKGTS
ncbi:MAG TPA: TlpA disulfide reductase family protein [Bacteroidota bacterium]|nr:TlpA disulfide reductase family protein [Bacteroidota bacterium]